MARHSKLARVYAMRALTVRQPWAWAIVDGLKGIENRSWETKHTKNLIAIHAGAGFDGFEDYPGRTRRPTSAEVHSSAIIGVVIVTGVVTRHRSKWFNGPLGWVLDKPYKLKTPIRCKGSLNLWKLTPRQEAKIWKQIPRSYKSAFRNLSEE